MVRAVELLLGTALATCICCCAVAESPSASPAAATADPEATPTPVPPSPATPPETTVKAGKLRGKWLQTRRGRAIAAFEGIPYAAPPVGELRFQAPQPAEPWDSVLEATAPGSKCTQKEMFTERRTITGSEDCLYLNVYTPEGVQHDKPLDVLFLIHGGGWTCLSGSVFEPDFFLDYEVILVTHNYRLGPLGFLSTNDDVLPGNYGMKDQVAALRWVRDNIAAFGGNRDSVTIFGESAGGASAHLHMLSPLSKGLFHKAIAQSGSALTPWAFAPSGEHEHYAARLAEATGCPVSPSAEFRRCLLTKSNTDIFGVYAAVTEWGVEPVIPFKPKAERGSGPGAFMERSPVEILASGPPVSDVPLMIGFLSEDGCPFSAGVHKSLVLMHGFDWLFSDMAPKVLSLQHFPKADVENAFQRIRTFYYGNSWITSSVRENTTNLGTDSQFAWPTLQAIKLQKNFGKSSVFMYEFAHPSDRSFSVIYGADRADYGVCHGDDLLYLFPLRSVLPGQLSSADDEIMSERMIDFFVTFAKTGRPTINNSWKSVSHPETAEYLHIGSPGHMGMRANYAPERMKLWSELPIQTGRVGSLRDEL